MAIDFHLQMRTDLASIMRNEKSTAMTFYFKEDTSTISDYGGPVETITEVPTTGIISPVSMIHDWTPDGYIPDSDVVAIVYDLEKDGTDYLTLEYFSQTTIQNVRVKIGAVYYQVILTRSPESIHTQIPYWTLLLRKLEEVTS